jgi:hypothetical protein
MLSAAYTRKVRNKLIKTVCAFEAGTLLKLTHERFEVNSPLGRRALEGMKPGWSQVLVRLGTMSPVAKIVP